ncbi:MAG TPA: glycosyltransferase family 4 protein [Burkholderiales bacterium]|nr:glycosyltransferase family 4 protein [Burkholderiales bacterium]
MNFAFCLYKYFPYGGLQRDFLRIAEEAARRAHRVTAYVGEWEGAIPDKLKVVIVPTRGLFNHYRSANFYADVRPLLQAERYDAVTGFNKIPGLDLYYAADVCFKDRTTHRSAFYRLMPRYRHFVSFEQAVFDPRAHTKILLLAASQREPYMRQYGTPVERFHVLPPDVAPDRKIESFDESMRIEAREQLQLESSERIVLMVGSGFKTKGLDRALEAMAALPPVLRARSRLLIVGQDNPRAYRKQALILGIVDRVSFLGGRDDIPRLLRAADVLIHPAYHENTGSVLLEAMASGLPVLVTDVCGYAPHVEAGKAGVLVHTPFQQSALNAALLDMLQSDRRADWGRSGIAYIRSIDTTDRVKEVVDLIEAEAERRQQ